MSPMPPPHYIAVVGPTASGKTSFAMDMGKDLNGALINCDSVQLYQGFDIGSAKTPESERVVPHYLFDQLKCSESFDAAQYQEKARAVIKEVSARGLLPIIVGGTGFYLRALMGEGFDDLPHDDKVKQDLDKYSTSELYQSLQDKDPKRATEIHQNDRYRLIRALEVITLTGKPVSEQMLAKEPDYKPACLIVLDLDRQLLHERIATRSKLMLEQGLIKEVEGLIAQGCPEDSTAMQSIGYKQALSFLKGELAQTELEEAITIATRQYAKRQCTWFRRVKADLVIKEKPIWSRYKAAVQRIFAP